MDRQARKRVRQAIAEDEADILAFTKQLVAIATENPPGRHYRRCAEAIAAKLSDIGLDHQTVEVPDPGGGEFPRFCILGGHGAGRTLYFHGHYDVVPASSPERFRPRIEGGDLFGRGTSDMKGGLAAMIHAVKAIASGGVDIDGRIGLTIVPDEETGGVLGSGYLADAGLLGRDGIGMLLAEPTAGTVWNANRGAISLRVTVKGKPAHVGLAHRGVNAFENALVVAGGLAELKVDVESRRTGYTVRPEAARDSILMMGVRLRTGSSFGLSRPRRVDPDRGHPRLRGGLRPDRTGRVGCQAIGFR